MLLDLLTELPASRSEFAALYAVLSTLRAYASCLQIPLPALLLHFDIACHAIMVLQDDELAAIPQRISQFQEGVNQLQSKLSLLKNLQPLWLRSVPAYHMPDLCACTLGFNPKAR